MNLGVRLGPSGSQHVLVSKTKSHLLYPCHSRQLCSTGRVRLPEYMASNDIHS